VTTRRPDFRKEASTCKIDSAFNSPAVADRREASILIRPKKAGPARVYERRVPDRMSAGECERLTGRAKRAGLSLSRYLVESGLASNPERSIDPAGRERQERALFFLRKLVADVSRNVG
jgi:hypothetical protein